jgi:hypothetical protein
MILFLLGRTLVQQASINGKVIVCTGPFNFYWNSVDGLGTLFLVSHSLLLTLSAASIIKVFYMVPKKEGLMSKFEFNVDDVSMSSDDISMSSDSAVSFDSARLN